MRGEGRREGAAKARGAVNKQRIMQRFGFKLQLSRRESEIVHAVL